MVDSVIVDVADSEETLRDSGLKQMATCSLRFGNEKLVQPKKEIRMTFPLMLQLGKLGEMDHINFLVFSVFIG